MRIPKLSALRPARRIGAALAIWMTLVTAAASAELPPAPPPPAVGLALGRVQASLRPIADGYASWMARRLEARGAAPGLSDTIRQGRPNVESTEQLGPLLSRAVLAGAESLLLVDLDAPRGLLRVTLRVYDTQSAELLGASTRTTADDRLRESGSELLQSLAPKVGLKAKTARAAPAIRVGHLAARGRALRALDAGELTLAWQELRGQRCDEAVALRRSITRAASHEHTPLAERARLLAERGEPDRAWVLLAKLAAQQARSPRPDADVLLAAADVQFARGRSTDAARYYEQAIALEPDLSDAHLGLGQVQAVRKQHDEARNSFERAAKLRLHSPRPLELLAKLDPRDPHARAQALLRAGERHAQGLGTETASQHFAQAVRLDASLEPRAQEAAGEMWHHLGRNDDAARSYQRAIEIGGESPDRLRALGQAQRLQGRIDAARTPLERALALEPSNAEAHHELALVYEHAGREEDAVAHLREAISLSPQASDTRSELARILYNSDQPEEALELIDSNDSVERASAEDLRLRAEILRNRGDREGAVSSLERALELRPAQERLRTELAEVQAETEEARSAAAQDELAGVRDGEEDARRERPSARPSQPELSSTVALGDLVLGFSPSDEDTSEEDSEEEDEPRRVAFLGMRERFDERGWVLDWLRPTTVDIPSLEAELRTAIGAQYVLLPPATVSRFTNEALDTVFDFEASESLDPASIAALNLAMGADAVFVARVARAPGGPEGYLFACNDAPFLEIELRRLDGFSASNVNALANFACLPGGLESYATWNLRAAGVYGGLLLAFVLVMLRGWGSVSVGIMLPPKTKALFSISVSRRPKRVKIEGSASAPNGVATRLIERNLRSLDFRERRLKQGKPSIFTWIAARSRPYYVTVRGPLLDYVTEDVIGNFLEEKTVTVKRGKRTEVVFDMRPKECALHVQVTLNDKPLAQALIARRGDPSSLLYGSTGSAFLYLGPGTHVILVGGEDRVAEHTVTIDDLEARALPIDLAREEGLIFTGCPEAVTPYIESDYEAAAEALEAAGFRETALSVRTTALEERGDLEAAGKAVAAAGRSAEAADLLLRAGRQAEAAKLFEDDAQYRQAAELRQQDGELAEASRLYLLDHAYDEAIVCLRELGDEAGLLDVLEMSGACFEAAELAERLGESDRAIANLQRVDPQLDCYVDACLRLGTLYFARGEPDGALDRYDEALRLTGAEEIPASALREYAGLLEGAGRLQDAVESYERAAQVGDEAASSQIEALRKQIETHGPVVSTSPDPTPPSVASGSQTGESRYEILEELGRGAMGIVYKARDTHLGRIVALKKLTDNLQQHPTAVRYFEREARAAAALNHPNIVTVYDAGQENGSYFISMEFMEGTPLDVILDERGALPAKTVARLGLHIATGLEYAHRNKIIHRDIKTANLFFTNDKVVKIMDFGLAKMVEEVRRASTIIAGTPYYMSPEQATGDNADHRADIYSLGVTLFQLVTGRVPFTEGDVTYHHRHTAPPNPCELAPQTPEPLARLILSALEKDREDRIQSSAEIVSLLTQMLG